MEQEGKQKYLLCNNKGKHKKTNKG